MTNNKSNEKLLAPNGKPSNLSPQQYKIVRTKAFKAWFGDWENDPKNASKIVDANGEPLVLYHGTRWKCLNEWQDLMQQLIVKDLLSTTDKAYLKKKISECGVFNDDKMIFLTEASGASEYYATHNKQDAPVKGGSVLEVFLRAKNPIIIDFNKHSFDDYCGKAPIAKDLFTFWKIIINASKANTNVYSGGILGKRVRHFGQTLKYINASKDLENFLNMFLGDGVEKYDGERVRTQAKLKNIMHGKLPKYRKEVKELIKKEFDKLSKSLTTIYSDLKKHDAFIALNVEDVINQHGDVGIANQYIALSSDDVKSATDNKGTFKGRSIFSEVD